MRHREGEIRRDRLPDINIVRLLGAAPQVVFSSEDYGERLAACLGARHVLVDRERRRVPCSGTAVRSDPLGNWTFLEPCVQAYYAEHLRRGSAQATVDPPTEENAFPHS